MLCPRPTPLNRRPTVPNLPNPQEAPSRAAGSFIGRCWTPCREQHSTASDHPIVNSRRAFESKAVQLIGL
jgi:hypothetical protein